MLYSKHESQEYVCCTLNTTSSFKDVLKTMLVNNQLLKTCSLPANILRQISFCVAYIDISIMTLFQINAVNSLLINLLCRQTSFVLPLQNDIAKMTMHAIISVSDS